MVFSSNGSFVGKGAINPDSKIRIRLFTRDREEEINEVFFNQKMAEAWLFRQKIGKEINCRLVFSEADSLPGLIIDKFDNVFVFQTLSLGIDLWKPSIIKALKTIFKAEKIYERNDTPSRALENLPSIKGCCEKDFDTIIPFNYQGIKFNIDLENNPKTGFYWEQLPILKAALPFFKGAKVLDLFCAGGWLSIHAAKNGATEVLGIDHDTHAIQMAESHATLNQVNSKYHFQLKNVFDALNEEELKKQSFDIIILDPPALIKSKTKMEQAISAYAELNFRSMKIIKSGGILISTCSSYLISEEKMIAIFQECAKSAGKNIRLLQKINQPMDHPILWNIASTNYFKGFVLEIK